MSYLRKIFLFSLQDGVVVTMKTVFPEELSCSGLRTESLMRKNQAHIRARSTRNQTVELEGEQISPVVFDSFMTLKPKSHKR